MKADELGWGNWLNINNLRVRRRADEPEKLVIPLERRLQSLCGLDNSCESEISPVRKSNLNLYKNEVVGE